MTTACASGGPHGAARWVSRSTRSHSSLTDATLPRAELIGGQQFTRPERTPHLRALVDRAQSALEAAVRLVARDGRVLRDADVLLTVQAVAIPDLTVYRGPTCDVPD